MIIRKAVERRNSYYYEVELADGRMQTFEWTKAQPREVSEREMALLCAELEAAAGEETIPDRQDVKLSIDGGALRVEAISQTLRLS